MPPIYTDDQARALRAYRHYLPPLTTAPRPVDRAQWSRDCLTLVVGLAVCLAIWAGVFWLFARWGGWVAGTAAVLGGMVTLLAVVLRTAGREP